MASLIETSPLSRLKAAAGLAAVTALMNVSEALAADPAGSGPIVNAVAWVQGTLLGNIATMVAVIAVAMVGFMMLTGRINWKMGATVILGVFVLFGAATIVAGIQTAVGR